VALAHFHGQSFIIFVKGLKKLVNVSSFSLRLVLYRKCLVGRLDSILVHSWPEDICWLKITSLIKEITVKWPLSCVGGLLLDCKLSGMFFSSNHSVISLPLGRFKRLRVCSFILQQSQLLTLIDTDSVMFRCVWCAYYCRKWRWLVFLNIRCYHYHAIV